MELIPFRRQRVGTEELKVLSLIDEHLNYIRLKMSLAHNTSVLQSLLLSYRLFVYLSLVQSHSS